MFSDDNRDGIVLGIPLGRIRVLGIFINPSVLLDDELQSIVNRLALVASMPSDKLIAWTDSKNRADKGEK